MLILVTLCPSTYQHSHPGQCLPQGQKSPTFQPLLNLCAPSPPLLLTCCRHSPSSSLIYVIALFLCIDMIYTVHKPEYSNRLFIDTRSPFLFCCQFYAVKLPNHLWTKCNNVIYLRTQKHLNKLDLLLSSKKNVVWGFSRCPIYSIVLMIS